MTKVVKEFVGIPIADYEDNYIRVLKGSETTDIERDFVSAVSLAREAGAESINTAVETAFEYLHAEAHNNWTDDQFESPAEKRKATEDYLESLRHWDKYLVEFRKKSGRQYPKLFKFKITIEVEELPEAETTQAWIEHSKKF